MLTVTAYVSGGSKKSASIKVVDLLTATCSTITGLSAELKGTVVSYGNLETRPVFKSESDLKNSTEVYALTFNKDIFCPYSMTSFDSMEVGGSISFGNTIFIEPLQEENGVIQVVKRVPNAEDEVIAKARINDTDIVWDGNITEYVFDRPLKCTTSSSYINITYHYLEEDSQSYPNWYNTSFTALVKGKTIIYGKTPNFNTDNLGNAYTRGERLLRESEIAEISEKTSTFRVEEDKIVFNSPVYCGASELVDTARAEEIIGETISKLNFLLMSLLTVK